MRLARQSLSVLKKLLVIYWSLYIINSGFFSFGSGFVGFLCLVLVRRFCCLWPGAGVLFPHVSSLYDKLSKLSPNFFFFFQIWKLEWQNLCGRIRELIDLEVSRFL